MKKTDTARIIVRNTDKQILMQQKSLDSKNAAGLWELPGGKIALTDQEKQELGDITRTARETVVEELKEEKNIDLNLYLQQNPESLVVIGDYEYSFYNSSSGQNTIRSTRLFMVDLPQSMLQDISKEGLGEDRLADYGWFTIEQISNMKAEIDITQGSQFIDKFPINKFE